MHRRIGFIGLAERTDLGDDRFRGWIDGAAAHRLPTRGLSGRRSDDIASAEELADSLLSLRQPPTAFVCVSDTMAMGVMRAIEQHGLRVGRDISVVGFDDSSLASVVRPGDPRKQRSRCGEQAHKPAVGLRDLLQTGGCMTRRWRRIPSVSAPLPLESSGRRRSPERRRPL